MAEEKLENLKKKPRHGGKRKNSGRKRGSKNKKTKEREIVEEEIRSRVLRSADKLITSQMNLAQGVQHLFKIETVRTKDKKTGKWKVEKKKPEIVTSEIEIASYLAGDYDDDKDAYYFITTQKPENKALDSLFDRVFGKAVQRTELSGPNGKDLPTPIYGGQATVQLSGHTSDEEDISADETD